MAEINATNVASIILQLDEIRTVIDHLNRKRFSQCAYWAAGTFRNLMVFRLSCCCGLRRVEIQHLRIKDVLIDGDRPAINIRKGSTKGRTRGRLVPLWWDRATFDDIADFVTWRQTQTDDPNEFLLQSPRGKPGRAPTRNKIDRRWSYALESLPGSRAKLSIHKGRHTYCSHALRAGRDLAEVRDAAGHGSATVTNIYLHAFTNGNALDLFEFPPDERD